MLLCLTSTRRLIRISNFLFLSSRFKLPFYEKIRDASKGFRTLVLFSYILYLTYMVEFARMYTDLKKRTVYEEYGEDQRQIIQSILNINLLYFMYQLIFMFFFMVIFAFYVLF